MFRNLSPLVSLHFNRRNLFALFLVCSMLITLADVIVIHSVSANNNKQQTNATERNETVTAPTDLDPTFGIGGKVMERGLLFQSKVFVYDLAVQTDGKIVALSGSAWFDYVSASGSIALIRYNADGTLDSTFDGDGIAIIFNAGDPHALAIQADGKIIVASYFSTSTSSSYLLLRYNSNGTPDTTFGNNGRVAVPFLASASHQGCSSTLQGDGKIVVATQTNSGSSGERIGIARYNTNGSLDTTFDGDGLVVESFNFVKSVPYTVAIQPDNKIVAAGFSGDFGSTVIGVVRFNTDGTLDNTFDGDGRLTTDIDSGDDMAKSIAFQPDGKIVIACNASNKIGVIRYNPNGALDNTFDNDGKVVTNMAVGAHSVKIQADGKIVVSGDSITGTTGDLAIVRYTSTGALDNTFDNDGILLTKLGSASIETIDRFRAAKSLAIQSDGKIVVAAGGMINPSENYSSTARLGRFNSNGTADNTFGVSGLVSTMVISRSVGDDIRALAIQSDGKIIVVGSSLVLSTSQSQSSEDFLVVRLNTNGTLDTSFDGDGKVGTDFNSRLDKANAIAIQPDGKIIVAGRSDLTVNNQTIFVLARYNPNGSLDNSFDGDGRIIANYTGGTVGAEGAKSIAIQSDGKIIVGGTTYDGSQLSFTVIRFHPDGSLDNSFDLDGVAVTRVSAHDYGSSLAIQTDGKIVIGGYSISPTNFELVRYNNDGSLDNTFGNGGKVSTDMSAGTDVAMTLRLQPDNKIVLAGGCDTQSSQGKFCIARYNSNGTLDVGFDGDGKAITSVRTTANPNAIANNLVIQPSGKLIAAGWSCGPAGCDSTWVRYQTNGFLDSTFGNDGIAITDLGSNMGVYGLALQSNGKIIASNHKSSDASGSFALDFIVARYMGDFKLSSGNLFDFDGDGKTDISIFRPSVGQWWYQRSSDNVVPAYTFGTSTDKIVPADYTGDGKTDIAFFRPSTSQWFILRSENNTFYAAPFGVSTDIPTPGDFDGDGKADLAVFRPSAGIWFILKSSDSGVLTVPFGVNQDVPVVADYDGDGKSDVAIYRPNGGSGGGEWWILRSTAGVFATPFGSATDKPVQGDYTGDGKADISFFRPSTGEWFVLRSENLTFFAAPFGTNGDIPSPGDYDGDNKFDFAVFRPSSATWFILKSTGGTQIQAFGTTGDIPVPSAFIP